MFSPFPTLIGLPSLAPGLAFAPAFGGDFAFVPAFVAFLALAAGLRAPLARDALLAFGFALACSSTRFMLPLSVDVAERPPPYHRSSVI